MSFEKDSLIDSVVETNDSTRTMSNEFNTALVVVNEKHLDIVVPCIEMVKNGKKFCAQPIPIKDWVTQVTLRLNIEVGKNLELYSPVLNRQFDKTEFLEFLNYMAVLGEGSGDVFSEKRIRTVLDEIIHNIVLNRYQNTLAELTFRTEAYERGQAELEKMLQVTTGKVDWLDFNVLKHWFWLVKRKMNRLPIDHHLMVVFFGQQGGGKSYLAQKMIAPLEGLYVPINFKQLTDDRMYKIYRHFPVILCDEMSGAEKACGNQIKYLLSSEYVVGRPMRSNDIEFVKNNATWLGTANYPLQEIIRDETGNRRFYQINCLPTGQWDRTAVNSLDYLSIWQSIDETSPSPLLAEGVLEAMYLRQKSDWRFKTLLEEFLIEADLIPESNATEVFFCSYERLRSYFINWLRAQGKQSFVPRGDTLGAQLSGFLVDDRGRVNGRQVRGYYLKRNIESDESMWLSEPRP